MLKLVQHTDDCFNQFEDTIQKIEAAGHDPEYLLVAQLLAIRVRKLDLCVALDPTNNLIHIVDNAGRVYEYNRGIIQTAVTNEFIGWIAPGLLEAIREVVFSLVTSPKFSIYEREDFTIPFCEEEQFKRDMYDSAYDFIRRMGNDFFQKCHQKGSQLLTDILDTPGLDMDINVAGQSVEFVYYCSEPGQRAKVVMRYKYGEPQKTIVAVSDIYIFFRDFDGPPQRNYDGENLIRVKNAEAKMWMTLRRKQQQLRDMVE